MRSTPSRHRYQLLWQTRSWDMMPDWACKADLAQDEFGRWWVRYYTEVSYYPGRRFEECLGPWSVLDPYAWFSPADIGTHPGHGTFQPSQPRRERACLKRVQRGQLYEFHRTTPHCKVRLVRLNTYHPRWELPVRYHLRVFWFWLRFHLSGQERIVPTLTVHNWPRPASDPSRK